MIETFKRMQDFASQQAEEYHEVQKEIVQVTEQTGKKLKEIVGSLQEHEKNIAEQVKVKEEAQALAQAKPDKKAEPAPQPKPEPK